MTTVTDVDDFQIICATPPIGQDIATQNQAPRPWNQAGPAATGECRELAAGIFDPLQQAPSGGGAPFGEIGDLAMEPF